MVNFPARIPGCDPHNAALLELFLSSDDSICSAMAFLPLANSDHVVVLVFIDFPFSTKWDVPLHHITYDYSHVDWGCTLDNLSDVPWEDVFKLSASAAASKFSE